MKFNGPFIVVAAMVLGPFSVIAQTLTVLHNFDFSQSAPIPTGRPLLAGGALYGVHGHGGSNDAGIVYGVNADGTGFTILHDFSSDTNGVPGENYVLLGSPDVQLPVAQWTAVATNTPDAVGSLAYAVAAPFTARGFFALALAPD